MRWHRPLRWGIAIAGLGFAGLLFVRYERKPAAPAPPLPPKMEGGASYKSTMSPGGQEVRYKNSVELGAWSYATLTRFDDGRSVLDKPRYEGDRDGKPYVVTADKAELKAAAPGANPSILPEETHLIGNVVMREQDGMEIRTGDATYRESIATMEIPGEMTFSDRRMTGGGIGAAYDRNAQLLTLKDQARIAMAPDESGQGKLDAHAKTITLNRAVHNALLDGGATIARDREVISAATVDMHLLEDNQGVQMMELRKRSSVVPIAGAGKTPEMRADDITLEFLPDGRTIKRAQLLRKASMFITADSGRKEITGDMLDVQLGADGQTVTNLTGNGGVVVTLPASADVPQRTIAARELNSTGDEKGLSSAVFKAPPPPSRDRLEFLETRPAGRGQAAAVRRVRSKQLALSLNAGDLSNIREAHFTNLVWFENGATSGDADDVTYFAASGKLVMRPAPAKGEKSHVATRSIAVGARNIDIDLDRIIIHAVGEVGTQTTPDKSAKTKGLFDESKMMFGKANDLSYDDAKNLAIYTGGAKLWQGVGKDESSIVGEKVSIDSTAGDLTAEGGVIAIFPIDNMEGASKQAPKATAAKFEYKDATHRALYTGTAKDRAVFNSLDGMIKGVTIEMFLSNDGRELQRMIVDGPRVANGPYLVQARVSADRTALGDHMVHDAKSGKYELTGNPAKVIEKSVVNGVDSCTESIAAKLTFTKTESKKEPGTFEYSDPEGAGSRTRTVANCAEWIIK